MLEKIRALWEQHEASPIPPGFRGLSLNGLTLTQIHCDIAANILTFINTGGHLGVHRVNSMVKTKAALDQSIEELPVESKTYIRNLKQISEMVLQQVQ